MAFSAWTSLLLPAARSSVSRWFSLLPPTRPGLLPGAAAWFCSTSATECQIRAKPMCDYNHYLITMDFPDPKPSREEMIETYLQTLAKVVGSYGEAKKRMYAFSTTTYTGFNAVMTPEISEKFRGLPGVVWILPDMYLGPSKEYGGDKYDNGVITLRAQSAK